MDEKDRREVEILIDARVNRVVYNLKMALWVAQGRQKVYRKLPHVIEDAGLHYDLREYFTVDPLITEVDPPTPFRKGDIFVYQGEVRVITEPEPSGYSWRPATDEEVESAKNAFGAMLG